jgi:hypothetical protein
VRDVVFARAIDPAGHAVDALAGEVWLQYWYFYIYNDAQFGGRIDLHEGDWEMVQIQLRDGHPAAAVYAQHAYAEQRDWDRVELDDELHCPVVYAGRGSHASYFEPGLRRTHLKLAGAFVPLWWDAADGRGRHIRQGLQILHDAELPGWASWPGDWGGTHGSIPGLDGDSPPAPIVHRQWSDPRWLAADPVSDDPQKPGTSPAVAVARAKDGLSVRFDFDALDDPPDRLVLTVEAHGEPPLTEMLVIDRLARGHVVTRGLLDPQLGYTVQVSTILPGGKSTQPQPPIALAPVRVSGQGLIPRAWDRLWLGIGRWLARRRAA